MEKGGYWQLTVATVPARPPPSTREGREIGLLSTHGVPSRGTWASVGLLHAHVVTMRDLPEVAH